MSSAAVTAQDHSFGLFDGADIPIETADWSTGLAVTMSSGVLIYTGADRGLVHVTAQSSDTAPELTDTFAWDDIVEVSIATSTGMLRVGSLESGPLDEPPALPDLGTAGPGSYRLRVHALGRDAHYDQAVADSGERYLLLCWPAPPAPSLIIRATDRCGYSLRVAQLHSHTRRTDSPPSPAGAEQQRRQREHSAILEGIKRLGP